MNACKSIPKSNWFDFTSAGMLGFAMLLILPASAQVEYPTGPEAGAKLAAELCLIRPEHDMEWNGWLYILHHDPKIPPISVVCRATAGETTWSRTYMTAPSGTQPAETLTVVFSANAPPKYFYARAPSTNAPVGELKPLTGAEADVPLAGSDFWLSDLGLDFFHWPQQIEQKWELHSSRGCFVLESINPHPSAQGYSRVKTWIDTEYRQPLEAAAYRADKTNDILKDFSVGDVTKMSDGHYEIKDIEMHNRRTGSTTRLEFDLEGK